MSQALPKVYLARHGETAWTLSGQHTGRTDIPLTAAGEENARSLGTRLQGLKFVKVFTSPLQRAKRTCELAGFGNVCEADPQLMEWDYGQYEGRRTADIRKERPNWNAFRDGCPGGESLPELSARADGVMERLRACAGDVLLFGHRDFLRVLAVRWISLPVNQAQHLVMTTATLSVLGYDHGLDEPAIHLWNDDRHLVRG